MKTVMICFGLFIGVLLLTAGGGFLAQGTDFFMFQFWAPKYAKVQRQVFENTPSYVKGTISTMELQETTYLGSNDLKAKEGLKSIILHEAGTFNMDDPDVPQDLRTFVNSLK